jgi:hypothetical protein
MNAETESRSTELGLESTENLNRSITVSLQTVDVLPTFTRSEIPTYVTVSSFDDKNKMRKVELMHKVGNFTDFPSLAGALISMIHEYLKKSYGRVIVPSEGVQRVLTYSAVPHQGASNGLRMNMQSSIDSSDNDDKITYLTFEENENKYIGATKKAIRLSRLGVRTTDRAFKFTVFHIDKFMYEYGDAWAKKNEFPWTLLDSYINYFVTRSRYAMPRSGDMDGLNVALYKHRSVGPYLSLLDNSHKFRNEMYSVMKGYIANYVSVPNLSPAEVRSVLKGQAEFDRVLTSDAQNSIDNIANADGVELFKDMLSVSLFNSRTRLHFNVGDLNSSHNEISQILECLVALLMPGHLMSDESYSVILNYLMIRLLGQANMGRNINVGSLIRSFGITDLNRDALSPIVIVITRLLALNIGGEWVDFLKPLRELCISFGSGGQLNSRTLSSGNLPISVQQTTVEAGSQRDRVSASQFLRVSFTELGDGQNNVPSKAWREWIAMGNALLRLVGSRGSSNFNFANSRTGPKVLSAGIRVMLERDNEMRMWSMMGQELIPLYMTPLAQLATDAFQFAGGYDLIPIANRSILAMFLKIQFSKVKVGAVTADIVHQGITMLDACEKVFEGIGVADNVVSELSSKGLLPYITRPDYDDWLSSGDIVRLGSTFVRDAGSQAVSMIVDAMSATGISATWHTEARKFYNLYQPPPLVPLMTYINNYPGLFGIAPRFIMWPIVSRVQRVDSDIGDPALPGVVDPPIPIKWTGYYVLEDEVDEGLVNNTNVANTLQEFEAIVSDPANKYVALRHTALHQLAVIPGKLTLLDDAVKNGMVIIMDIPCPTKSGLESQNFSSIQELFTSVGRNRVGPMVLANVRPNGTNVLYDEGYLDTGVKMGVESLYADFRYWPHQVNSIRTVALSADNPLLYYVPQDPFIFRSDFRFIGDQEYRMIN